MLRSTDRLSQMHPSESNVEDLRLDLGVTSADSSLSSAPFATPDAGFGYFATAEHYRHLAKGVVDALYRGGVVLVSGDPPACLPMLVEALRTAAAPRAVIEIS